VDIGGQGEAFMYFGSMKVGKFLECLSDQQLMIEECSDVIWKFNLLAYRPKKGWSLRQTTISFLKNEAGLGHKVLKLITL
jgi:hypothetical protein